jgi:N-methylhydantoinase B
VLTEPGSILNPQKPYAVAAGNVETSQRVVDVVFGALSKALPQIIPAASQGTMNNLTFGSRLEYRDSPFPKKQTGTGDPKPEQTAGMFAYYETIGGGIGAGALGDGGHGMHAHMSNTLNTPIEALEYGYPVRVVEYRQRTDSGGAGKYKGGDGLVRSLEFLAPVTVTVVSERRSRPAYGLNGGFPGRSGLNQVTRKGTIETLPGKFTVDLDTGDRLKIETPGGGGWGSPES